MDISLLMLEDFKQLFHIDPRQHGVFKADVDEHGNPIKDDKGKVVGKVYLDKEGVLESTYVDHLNGVQSLGGCMLYDGEHTSFAVLDVDVYTDPTLITTVLHKIYDNKMPIVPFRSKSGGLHLYIFFEPYLTGEEAITCAQSFRRLLHLPTSTEIFPKQRTIQEGAFGSWINLPYFNAEHTDRYIIGPNNEAVPYDIALPYCKRSAVSLATVATYFDDMPFNDGPPCLQTIWLDRDTNQRNKYLFAVGVYSKSKFADGFERLVTEANNRLVNPLPTKEVSDTIIASLSKKDYTYICGDDPLKSCCQKELCKQRTYGVGGENVSDLSYEQLTQMGEDVPYYRWIVNGKPLIFHNESEIINQQRFRELAFRELHVLPNRIKEFRWVSICNNALSHIDKGKEEEVDEGMMEGGNLLAFIGEYITQGAFAMSLEQVMMGKVWKDNKNSSYIFKGQALMDFIINQKKYRGFSNAEVQEKIKRLGGISKRRFVNERNNNTRVWYLPFDALDGEVDNMEGINPIAYIEAEKEEQGEF